MHGNVPMQIYVMEHSKSENMSGRLSCVGGKRGGAWMEVHIGSPLVHLWKSDIKNALAPR
jgi:hypothetical protein